MSSFDRLTRAELSAMVQPAPPPSVPAAPLHDDEPAPWLGSAGGEVARLRSRVVHLEEENRELRAELSRLRGGR